jgi:BlaI family transcriptional regulator, penicillinase repressor
MVQFTDRELDLMRVLWERGPSTVAEVQKALPDDLAYTTVLTLLKVLEDKGHVAHTEEGKAHRFHPLVARDAASASAIERVKDQLFSGSVELLLTHLVQGDELTVEELERLRDLLDRRLAEEDA